VSRMRSDIEYNIVNARAMDVIFSSFQSWAFVLLGLDMPL